MYKIVQISFNPETLEQLGTKEKFWFKFKSSTESSRWLFKYSRDNTGEHWSEKIAEQLCVALEIPHVGYEIAKSHDRLGIITENVVAANSRMIMGNEVLHQRNPISYPRPFNDNSDEELVRVKEHTIAEVLNCLDSEGILPPESALDLNELNAGDIFCGYLMLDTLISNQDRHHENWAVIINDESGHRFLCPTYDHAASLGRELLDPTREDRLKPLRDNRSVNAFVKRARSELFEKSTDNKALFTIDAYYLSVKDRPAAHNHWINKLENLNEDIIRNIVNKVPNELMTHPAKEFAIQMILENKKRLLER